MEGARFVRLAWDIHHRYRPTVALIRLSIIERADAVVCGTGYLPGHQYAFRRHCPRPVSVRSTATPPLSLSRMNCPVGLPGYQLLIRTRFLDCVSFQGCLFGLLDRELRA